MASEDTTQPPTSASNHVQHASLVDANHRTKPVNQDSFMRVDDLEGRLRGLILQNKTSTTENAAQSAQLINSSSPLISSTATAVSRNPDRTTDNGARSLKSEKGAKVRLPPVGTEGSSLANETPGHDGQASDSVKQRGAPQGRSRRPNQAQRRQLGKIDLQDLNSALVKDAQQSASQAEPLHVNRPHLRKTPNGPRASNTPATDPAPKPHYPQQIHHQRYQTGQQQHAQNNPPMQVTQHFQNPPQRTSYGGGFMPDANPQLRPASLQYTMPPHNMSHVYQNRLPQSRAEYDRFAAGHYTRPVAPNRQLYQGDLPQTNYYQRSNWLPHPDINAQNAFVHKIGEVVYAEAKASPEELQEKENLRLLLRNICVQAVSEHERAQNPKFRSDKVDLACFGSLRSGFATRGSDMDLALVSPCSSPDPASAESDIPRLLEKVLLDLGYGARLLTKTRVPIIRFCETPTAELLEALHKNRAKWERERDAPPKPMKKKKQLTKNKNRDDDDEVEGGAGKPTVRSVKEESPNRMGTSNATDSPDASNNDNNSAAASSRENPTTPAEKPIRASETSVRSRTDEELVRLYKLAIKEGWFEPSERLVIVKFIEAVQIHGAGGDHQEIVYRRLQLEDLPDVLSRYRVPPESHLDYPKIGVGIQCDVNFSNHLALHNTRLLRCYSLCDPRVQPTIIVVKAWAKSRKINSSYHGTLSSYGYVLMALHYLMNVCQPPIIPNLQLVPQASTPENDYGLNGYNVQFWQSEHEILEAAHQGQLTQNHTDTVGSLLRGFFQYYAHPHGGGFSWMTDVLSLRTPGGILRKEDKGWTGARTVTVESTVPGEDDKEVRHRYLFAIEDPFELEHNVARTVVHNGIIAIRDEFRRADKIIQTRATGRTMLDGDLFAEAASKENLQRRFFGPLIKPSSAAPYHQKKEDSSKVKPDEELSDSIVKKEPEVSEEQQGERLVKTVSGVMSTSEIPLSNVEVDLGKPAEPTKIDQHSSFLRQLEGPPTPVSSTLDTTDSGTPIAFEDPSTPNTGVSLIRNDVTVEGNESILTDDCERPQKAS